MYTDTSKTTFIPKAPVTTIQQPTSISGVASEQVSAHGVGFLGWIGLMLMFATIIGAGGLFLYVGYFQSQQTAVVEGLKKKQSLVDTQFISDAQRLSSRIGYAKDLLQHQVYVSPLFAALHLKTLPAVQYNTFELREKSASQGDTSNSGTGEFQAILKGEARSYEVIAQQSDVYATSTALKTHFFSEFKVGTVKNLIGFTLTIDLPVSLGHEKLETQSATEIDVEDLSADATVIQDSRQTPAIPVPTQ